MAKPLSTVLDNISLALNVVSEQHEGSLIEFTQVSNSRITVTLEDKLAHLPVTSDILKFSTNLYAGYYMQAVSLLCDVNGLNVRQTLDRLNPNRDLIDNAKDRALKWVAVESYLDYPTYSEFGLRPALESSDSSDSELSKSEQANADRHKSDLMKMASDPVKVATDAPNLAVGKIFNVTIHNNGKTAIVPVGVSLHPVTCSKSLIVNMFAKNNLNNTWISRIKRWSDGELSTIGDMIMVNDVIADRAALLKADKSKIRESLDKKRRKNSLSAILSQKTSLGTASTISIMSKTTAAELEVAVGGRLSNQKVRNEIMTDMALMMFIIVDEMYEMVEIYYRGIERKTELTFAECKFSAKGDGPNAMEILKAFQNSQTPNI